MLDTQIGGDHYTKMKIQPVQFIHANSIPFIEGTVIKYVSRWKSKGGLQDLEKARHMVSMLIAYGPDEHAVYMPSFDSWPDTNSPAKVSPKARSARPRCRTK